MKWLRSNPPARHPNSKVARLLAEKPGLLREVGAKKLLGCGSFGCTYSGRPGEVVKITRDPYEAKMVRLIRNLRGRPAPGLGQDEKRLLSSMGMHVGKAMYLRGIVGLYTDPRKVAHKAWSYRREDVRPLDFGVGWNANRELDQIARGLDEFFHRTGRVNPRDYLGRYPKLRYVVETAVWLDLAHGLTLEDVHEEQVGVVIKTGPLHRAGSYVLFDGQLD